MVAMVHEKVTAENFTDYHCHLIPGLDDGPLDVSESLEMAYTLASFGFKNVYCTPHYLKETYDINPNRVKEAVAHFQEALNREGVLLTIQAAAEYHIDEFLFDFLDDPILIGEELVLLEAHQYIQAHTLLEMSYRIITNKKLRPLLAHPERYDLFDEFLKRKRTVDIFSFLRPQKQINHGLRSKENPGNHQKNEDILTILREMGCLFQGNIGSFAGIYGGRVKNRAIRLLELGFYDHLGTDAHRPQNLAVWLKRGMDTIRQVIGEETLSRLLQPLNMPES